MLGHQETPDLITRISTGFSKEDILQLQQTLLIYYIINNLEVGKNMYELLIIL